MVFILSAVPNFHVIFEEHIEGIEKCQKHAIVSHSGALAIPLPDDVPRTAHLLKTRSNECDRQVTLIDWVERREFSD